MNSISNFLISLIVGAVICIIIAICLFSLAFFNDKKLKSKSCDKLIMLEEIIITHTDESLNSN